MASVKAPTKLAKQMSGIAASWTRDPFRPNIQLQTLLQSLATHPRLTPQAVQAARALQDNEMYKQYPLSKKTLQPASTPHHYDRLVEGFEKSAQGIGRPWWKIFFGIW
ncbi:hypothetical protein Hypma_013320 [Hypsizygus marmoreus]|uniref:Uncharacterized protein n=1 Tax=Hypsizygus marmoreus TaxID=39966 RepID=A0A369JE73_HYPMA|nr:hypothetical protein Hypma_013320 [Hypsizygus marmoreus]